MPTGIDVHHMRHPMVCERVAEHVPVVLMVYVNVVMSAGAEAFALRAPAAGASGLIVRRRQGQHGTRKGYDPGLGAHLPAPRRAGESSESRVSPVDRALWTQL
jgi:hypothetical protein